MENGLSRIELIVKIMIVVFLLILAGVFQAKGVRATNIEESCINSTESNYQNCWNDGASACVYVRNTENGVIDTDNIYCNSLWGNGICAYKGSNLNCRKSLNPIQAAVDIVSEKNKSLGKLQYEALMEPGKFTIEQKTGCVFGGPECTGFKRIKNGEIVNNVFGQGRFGVQVPSFTKIRGTLKNNEQQSVLFMAKESYDAFGEAFINGPGAKGGGVEALLMLTNVVGDGNGTKESELKLYNESLNNPVNHVAIENIRLLGVGGIEYLKQTTNLNPVDYYCTAEQCNYKYTTMFGISGKRIKGGDVKIIHNKLETFSAFIMLGHFFNLHTPSWPQDLTGEGFVTQLRADGEADAKIEIRDNYMDGAIGADSVIVWGSNILIDGNTVKNGHSDWYGNQIAISPYTDSENVWVTNNIIENYLTGVNAEGFIPIAGTTEIGGEITKNTARVAKGIVIKNNVLKNVLVCAALQRQNGTKYINNNCSFDYEKWKRLSDYNYYADGKYRFLTPLVGNISQKQAQVFNSTVMGSGLHIRTGQNMEISNNTFDGFHNGIFWENINILTGGSRDNVVTNNKYALSGEEAQSRISYVASQGLTDIAFGVYWDINGDSLEASNNKFCNDNVFPYPLSTGRLYSDLNFPGQLKDVDCSLLKTLGDANGDRKVDLNDFAIWKKEYLGQLTSRTADNNNDAKVNLEDFVIWKKAYLGL